MYLNYQLNESAACCLLQYVPTEVLVDFNIQLPPNMIFRDQYERKWPGEVAVWKDGRTWIGGWRTFCKWNNVMKDDKCICEFIGGNLIHVHIVRAGQT